MNSEKWKHRKHKRFVSCSIYGKEIISTFLKTVDSIGYLIPYSFTKAKYKWALNICCWSLGGESQRSQDMIIVDEFWTKFGIWDGSEELIFLHKSSKHRSVESKWYLLWPSRSSLFPESVSKTQNVPTWLGCSKNYEIVFILLTI